MCKRFSRCRQMRTLFYVKNVAAAEVTTLKIYSGAVPFRLLLPIGLGRVWFFPSHTAVAAHAC